MNQRLLTLASLFTSFALAACSGGVDENTSGSSGAGGAASSASTGQSSGSGDASSSSSSSGAGGGVPLGMPISAPKEQWTWVPFDDAFCANGSTTGIGVNLTDKSKRVIIYLQGGGACWDALTCYTLKLAANFSTGYGSADFAVEVKSTLASALFDRNNAGNPFKDYSMVFVPYCTGDVHAGSNKVMYGNNTAMHVGWENMTAYLSRIVPTFPGADRVYI